MNLLGKVTLASSALFALVVPAFAGITVNTPAKNTEVTTPFTLSASSAVCSSKNVTTMGYSFDSSSDTSVVSGQSLNVKLSPSTGTHTLHVKAWGPGTSCVSDVALTVKAGSSGPTSIIPSNADKVSSIEVLDGWKGTHDTGGPGSSSGSTSLVSSPSLYGNTRRFVTSYSNSGDERYSVEFNDNVDAENIFYDTWVFLTTSSNKLANLEFDVNQVMADGKTVLIGVQCDGYSGQWAYTVNTGSASSVKPKWVSKSGTSCNPRSWTQNTWHHVQASFSRDSSGYIHYKSVWLDGKENTLNVYAYGAANLGWGPVVNTQFQVDGLGSSGSVTAYVDNLTISMW